MNFLEASPEELTAWRGLACSQAAFQWLESELEKATDSEHLFLMQGETDKAHIAAGYVDSLRRVLTGLAFTQPRPLPDLMASPFVDTATRPSKLKGPK